MDDLSAREQKVVWLLAWGFSTKQVASRLEISVKTVETYKARAFEKLKINTRVELTRYAFRQGLFKVDPDGPAALGEVGSP